MEERVEAVEYQLPMSYDVEHTKFYVRECYLEYYQLVKERLENPTTDYVSLTGTPGIYLLIRYRKVCLLYLLFSKIQKRKSKCNYRDCFVWERQRL